MTWIRRARDVLSRHEGAAVGPQNFKRPPPPPRTIPKLNGESHIFGERFQHSLEGFELINPQLGGELDQHHRELGPEVRITCRKACIWLIRRSSALRA